MYSSTIFITIFKIYVSTYCILQNFVILTHGFIIDVAKLKVKLVIGLMGKKGKFLCFASAIGQTFSYLKVLCYVHNTVIFICRSS